MLSVSKSIIAATSAIARKGVAIKAQVSRLTWTALTPARGMRTGTR